MTTDSSGSVVPAPGQTSPTAVRIIVLIVPRRRGDLASALPWFLGRAIAR